MDSEEETHLKQLLYILREKVFKYFPVKTQEYSRNTPLLLQRHFLTLIVRIL